MMMTLSKTTPFWVTRTALGSAILFIQRLKLQCSNEGLPIGSKGYILSYYCMSHCALQENNARVRSTSALFSIMHSDECNNGFIVFFYCVQTFLKLKIYASLDCILAFL